MKLIKCGKCYEYNYCITQQLSKSRIFKTAYYELFLDVSSDEQMMKWLMKHSNDDDIRCLGISYGVVSVGMNGKPKTKFKDRKFARFRLQTCTISEVMEYADHILSRIYEFKIMANIECIDV